MLRWFGKSSVFQVTNWSFVFWKEGLNKPKMEFVKRCIMQGLEVERWCNCRYFQRASAGQGSTDDEEAPAGVEEVWKNFKECLTEEAIEVCGETRGMRRHKESWWWNEEIAALVKEKQRLFKLWKRPKKCRKGCRCEKTDKRKLCRRGKEARGMDCTLECNMDMESRKQE